MRIVKTIPHPHCLINLYHWNNKYLIKLEAGPFEQTYKVPETEILSEADLIALVNPDFIEQAMTRFNDMSKSLGEALSRI